MREFSELNDKYFEEVKKGVNSLVDCKVAVHAHDKTLDDQIDEFKAKIGAIDGNIAALEKENSELEGVAGNQTAHVNVTLDNLDMVVKPANPLSTKLIKLQAKSTAIEECMGVVKKGFDNDVINIDDYLKTIRNLAKKQCRQIFKINRITHAQSMGAPGGMPG